jgi:hypothetical protein
MRPIVRSSWRQRPALELVNYLFYKHEKCEKGVALNGFIRFAIGDKFAGAGL